MRAKNPSTRCIFPAKRKRIRRRYADMRIRELPPCCWGVVEPRYDRVVVSGFVTQAAAWDWLDLNTSQDRARCSPAIAASAWRFRAEATNSNGDREPKHDGQQSRGGLVSWLRRGRPAAGHPAPTQLDPKVASAALTLAAGKRWQEVHASMREWARAQPRSTE